MTAADPARRSAERTTRALATVGQFSVGIAHDFNNLLAIIVTNAKMLAESYPPEAGMPEELRDVITAAELGSEMVRRLLRFARQQPVDAARVSLHAVMDELPRRLRVLLPDVVRLKVDCENAPLLVMADAGAIEEVLINLVTNARDAMADGGTLRVSVRSAMREAGVDACGTAMPPGQYVTITVRDTGSGIDEATRHRMFEPFFTTKPLGEGAGLGLAMSYSLVRQLSGYIEVASTPSVGTSVIVSLPAVGADGAVITALPGEQERGSVAV
jgi:signal transduction histidine kinase